ncbi:hypothetical protein FOQG_04377 [Fusarium oxysporum f. sp. raphani 54005]|uniref:Uncharacterized protein n=5 Tax=Fusarium oxysporum TaxID=5507 RepID=X0CTP5_FUSOX|nr:hypothetical protein FOZG_07256 [Fusarium oxysporum Fo47]EXA00628.1 hypothetical protein FOWG_00788 [Fusarium oxysporum f. sp. lycopersici MN25]EXA47456.1 hypothetical protein FOVG_04561 [Fusarium oxysporum f. sp. pisi HDV247]EXK94229.1 hypothetical protein FOQG_04377 [Fusarium oxysporum f. sp. raphani 54005]EXL59311.1 hypothetical protein FOCG_02588 [Fusarium oxysporum f. sp. radicis-lycopersici 26381]EXL89041.1 hypothetical protein FOPG_00503 [Fusarium oxysporum f. sp. conglutinans race 2
MGFCLKLVEELGETLWRSNIYLTHLHKAGTKFAIRE